MNKTLAIMLVLALVLSTAFASAARVPATKIQANPAPVDVFASTLNEVSPRNPALSPALKDVGARVPVKCVNSDYGSSGKCWIRECGVISVPGEYVLDANVSSPDTCFYVFASGVTLDCAAHYIHYAEAMQGDGVHALYANNARVRNCFVDKRADEAHGYYAFVFEYSNNSVTENNWVRTLVASSMGVGVLNSFNATVRANEITSDGASVWVSQTQKASVFGNELTSNNAAMAGVYVANAGGVEIVGNNVTAKGDSFQGILAVESPNALIQGNRVLAFGSRAHGVWITYSDAGVIENNTILTNAEGGEGIVCESNDATIRYNHVVTAGNGANGIWVTAGDGNQVTDNEVETRGLGAWGIAFVVNTDENRVARNKVKTLGNWWIRSLGAYGLMVSDSNRNAIENNSIETFGRQSHAVYVVYSTGNEFANNYAAANGEQSNAFNADSYYASSVMQNEFKDGVLRANGAGSFDVYFEQSGSDTLNLLNASFNASKVSFSENAVNSVLLVLWYLHAFTRDDGQHPIPNSLVKISSLPRPLRAEARTDGAGYAKIVLRSYVQTLYGRQNYYPFSGQAFNFERSMQSATQRILVFEGNAYKLFVMRPVQQQSAEK